MKASSGHGEDHWYSVGSALVNWSVLSISLVCLLILLKSTASTETCFSYFHNPTLMQGPGNWSARQIFDQHELKQLKSGEELEPLANSPHDPVESWNRWTTRSSHWYTNDTLQNKDPNWPGRRKMHEALATGSLWWDEDAEEYITTQIEKAQYPANCSQTHWIAHPSWFAGMCSNLHQVVIPLLIGVMRGYTVLDIDREKKDSNPTYFGCSSGNRNLNCFFNLTTCNLGEDPYRQDQVENGTTTGVLTWGEVLTEVEERFPPGEITIVEASRHYACSGPFTYDDAFTAGKVKLIRGMITNGMVGVHEQDKTCFRNGLESRRMDFALVSMMGAWILSKASERVRLIAETIMARYSDESGRPAWNPPVLGIHIRQTDKKGEDSFWKMNKRYRNASDYVDPMRKLENDYGFKWPSIFLISDSGSALSEIATEINGPSSVSDPLAMYNSSNAASKDGKRLIMYDWTSDTHIYEQYGAHAYIPKELKVNLQEHFLATLYILQQIADYAIVTYSSNVGRYIGEIMTAKHRMAYPEKEGPVILSLDNVWGHD